MYGHPLFRPTGPANMKKTRSAPNEQCHTDRHRRCLLRCANAPDSQRLDARLDPPNTEWTVWPDSASAQATIALPQTCSTTAFGKAMTPYTVDLLDVRCVAVFGAHRSKGASAVARFATPSSGTAAIVCATPLPTIAAVRVFDPIRYSDTVLTERLRQSLLLSGHRCQCGGDAMRHPERRMWQD